jgi:hypothetical protein
MYKKGTNKTKVENDKHTGNTVSEQKNRIYTLDM